MGDDKLWAPVGDRPLIAVTLGAVAAAELFERVVIVAPRARWEELSSLAAAEGLGGVELLEGGERRQDSVRAALAVCAGFPLVCVHDGARPLCPPALFTAAVTAAERWGAATTAVAFADSVKRVAAGRVVESVDRAGLVSVQTPQAFRTELLVAAHRRAAEGAVEVDDDSSLVERLGEPVAVVDGDPANLKVTSPADLELIRRLGGPAAAPRPGASPPAGAPASRRG